MAKPDDIEKLPLPKSWPKLARRALVLVNSMLKVSFDIELGRRLDCAVRAGTAGYLGPVRPFACVGSGLWGLEEGRGRDAELPEVDSS